MPQDAVCDICGSDFQQVRNRLTCSDVCAKKRKSLKFKEWLQRNPSYMREYKSSPRYKEQARAYSRRYREENLERVTERFKEWEARNPKHTTEWVRRNRERAREQVRRRRARLKGVDSRLVTERDIRRLYWRQRGQCAYCGVSLGTDYHVDHVIPVSRGGRNSVGNLLLACPTCNLSKGDKLLSEWRYRNIKGRDSLPGTLIFEVDENGFDLGSLRII